MLQYFSPSHTHSFPCNLLFSHVFLFPILDPRFLRAHQKFQARKTTDSLLHLVSLLPGSVYLVATWEADWKCKANCERELKSVFASVGCSLDSLLSSKQRSAVVCELCELQAYFVSYTGDGNYCRENKKKFVLLFLIANIPVASRNAFNVWI